MKERFWNRLTDKMLDAWWFDIPVAVLVFLLAVLLKPAGNVVDLLGRLSLERRLNLYTDLITIATLLGGFLGLAFTTYLGWSSRAVTRVKNIAGDRLLIVWLLGIASPWLSAFLVWLAKALDRGDVGSSNNARWLAFSAVLLMFLTFMRLMTLFIKLAKLNDQPFKHNSPVNPDPLVVPDHFLNNGVKKSKH